MNSITSKQASLPYAGCSQGSALLPLLFLFFNASLVKIVINKCRRAIAFVNDYFA